LPLKTSPSGGARHSLEVYPILRDVEGVEEGVYRYSADCNRLEPIKACPVAPLIRALLPTQPWFEHCTALFAMTAVFERSQWRYNFPRAYRAVLLEAGHLGQTFALVATERGLAPFSTIASIDDVIEGVLGIDGLSEAAIYIVGVGAKPRDGLWRPFPSRLGGAADNA